ncbi:MAG: aminoglycoside phosphotransferase family protein [Armatimonas sp.]
MAKMHPDEVETNPALVRRLLATQFPQWAELDISPIPSGGTDNAIYRLGDALAVRMPRIGWAVGQIEKEHTWLPRLAPHLPLAVPTPLAKGVPGEGYPYPWAVCEWLEGENATLERLTDHRQAALDLAEFIKALQRIDTSGGPMAGEHNFGRGVPLIQRDAAVRSALEALKGIMDTDAATAIWEWVLSAPEWDRAPVWLHGDLQSGNLLAQHGRLSAVIDFGGLGVGDPACELLVAWTLFTKESRSVFREALSVDDATWLRGQGWALSVGLIALPYYLHTSPAMVAFASRTIAEVLGDTGKG